LHFGHFSAIQEYRQVNRELISAVFTYLPPTFFHVDIATGTGLVPQLMIEEAERRGYSGTIIGIDPNRDSLDIARARIRSTEKISAIFLEGYGQETEALVGERIPPPGADMVSIHDAIHEVQGEASKREIFAAMARILKPGGVLTYNSAFTSIATGDAALEWGKWKSRALKELGKRRDRAIEAIRRHTPEEYISMIGDEGLVVVHEAAKAVALTKKAIWAISQYPEFIQGVFRDMLDEGTRPTLKGMSEALVVAFESLHKDNLPMVWHEVIALKPVK
jgi:ubiquinone/menaquinone biosynthesis C-methylase UbiE